jgi:thiol-disulfide isomerase/thioredoxin
MAAPAQWWLSRFATRGILPIAVIACGLATLLAPTGRVFGEEEDGAAAITIAGIRLGNLVSGPLRSPESLAHRVVVLEFWGVNCPPCIKSMPTLESLHRQLGPAGLTVIGAHAQEATPVEIREVIDELGVTFTIVENASVAGGMDFTGIPHCMVFDHTGSCIYRGHPARAHDLIVAAVRSSPAAVLEGRELKKLGSVSRQLRDESAFAAVLKKAESLARSADPETAREAAYVAEKLKAYGQRLLDGARDAEAADPLRAVSLAQRCVAAYRGSDTGTQAASLLRAWKQDRRFQDSIKAARQCSQLEAARTRILRALGDPEEITPELAERVPEPLRKQLADTVASIHDLSPGSAAATRADEIATELGVAVSP